MPRVNRTGDCGPEGGGGSERTERGTVGRRATRKRAGIIAARETVKHVCRSRTIILFLPRVFAHLIAYVFDYWFGVLYRCATCIMGMMGVFKWLRKDIVQRDRNRRSLTPKINGLNNEAYRNAIQAFIDRRRNPSDPGCIVSPNSPDKERLELFIKKNYEKRRNDKREYEGMPGVPHIKAPEIFEIGWVAGTEDRLIELIFAEWQNTRVSLRRHTHIECRNAVKADLEVLMEIRHPNVLLLMATTHTDDHGLVAIFESIDCTLYNYVHEQGERVSVQGIAKCAGSLAGALKHAHMRGYVHGAISPHCVYLATCGTVKLGGWELAASINSPKIVREYEERLRFEIFRWQAPEIYEGKDPSKATDVYGLTLLMWEMCTMNVPWSGLSKSDVERQYVQCERGVVTDLYDFPPLLKNLLDAGLQLDVSKRTLDMGRVRRFLQTLEIQYEDADPLYVEPLSNNNNPHKPVCTPPTGTSPKIHRCTSAQTPKRYAEKKSFNADVETSCAPRLLNMNLADEPKSSEPRDFLTYSRNETPPSQMFEQILKGSSVERTNARNVNKSRSSEKLLGKATHVKPLESQRKLSSKEYFLSAVRAARAIDSTDDESSTDTRRSIKKLKQSLASRRENFFYGSDSSQYSPPQKSESTKSRILTEVRSKAYEPHKPASHKTSLQPKQTKSPGQYSSVPSRSAHHQSQKSPYANMPVAVRDAVVQPKVLNSDSQSFFESSLWKKEKMICISRMRKSNDFTYLVSRYPTIANESADDKAESAGSNNTYTIDTAIGDGTKDITDSGVSKANETMIDDSASTIPRSKSLQALKDALERATDIVRSTTPQTESSNSSPFKSPRSLEKNPNSSAASESLFEQLYELRHDEPDSEIKSIERSMNGEDTFLRSENTRDGKEDSCQPKTDFVIRRRSAVRDELKRGSFDNPRLSGVVCESIAENWNENETSSSGSIPDDRTVIISRSPENPESTVERLASFDILEKSIETEQCQEEVEENKQPDHETSFALMVFSDKSRGCNSCNPKSVLARRRSLPAALGQLRNLSNVSLGKLPIRKADVPDNTVEDLYIDDEFGDSLNVNMVLLDGDTLDDEDFLPDLLELSDLREYQ